MLWASKAFLLSLFHLKSEGHYEFWNNVELTSLRSLQYIQHFGDDFVRDVFNGKNFSQYHETWQDYRSKWILGPFYHLRLNKKLDESILEMVDEKFMIWTLISRLIKSQRILKFVGRNRRDKYSEKFIKSSFIISTILVELTNSGRYFRLLPKRKVVKSRSNIRDWIAYRDTLILLQTVKQIAHFYKNRHRSLMTTIAPTTGTTNLLTETTQ